MKAVKGPSYRGPLGFHLLFSEASLAPPSAVRALVNLARYLTDVGFGCSFGFGVLGFSSPPCFAIHAFGPRKTLHTKPSDTWGNLYSNPPALNPQQDRNQNVQPSRPAVLAVDRDVRDAAA